MEDHYAALGGLSDRFTKAELDAKWKAAEAKYDEALLAYAILSKIDIEEFQEFREDFKDYSRYFKALGLTGDEDDFKKALRNQFASAKNSHSKSRDAYELLSDPAKRKQYDKQRKKYAKMEEEIWVSSVIDSLQEQSSKPSKKKKSKKDGDAESAVEKAEKQAQKIREDIERKERYRLERNLEDLGRNLAMLSKLHGLVRSMDVKALKDRLSAHELKSVNDSMEVLIEAFKRMKPTVEYLTGVFRSLKKKPAESSSSQLCGDEIEQQGFVRNAEENGEERRKSTQHVV